MARVAGIGVVAVALAAYVSTVARDLVFGDSPELTAVAVTLGVAHAPGYPLWTLLGHVFSLLPLGPVPFRVGLLSAVSAAACVGVVYAAALRLSRSVPASCAAALLLAVTPLFWSWAIVPEVFALNGLLAAVVLYCAFRWSERPSSWRWLAGATFAGGLGLANQQTIVLLAPAIGYLISLQHRAFRTDPSLMWRALAGFALGLTPYVYLPIAAATDPAWSFGDISSLSDWIGQISRAAYGSGQLITNPGLQGGTSADRLTAFAQTFPAIEAVLVGLGFVEAWRRSRPVFWSLVVAFAFSGPLFVAYANADVRVPLLNAVLERFFVQPHVVVAPLAALGVLFAVDLPKRSGLRLDRRVAELGVSAVAVAVVVVAAATQWGTIDRSGDHVARDFGIDLLASAPPGAMLIVAGDAAAFPVEYLQTIERLRPDVRVVQRTYLPADWYVRQLRRRDTTIGLPYPAFDRAPATFRAFLGANERRPTYLAGAIFDESTQGVYVGEPRGLLQLVIPIGATLDPDGSARETDRLFTLYHVPSAASGRAFERAVQVDYGLALVRVGHELEAAKRPAEARSWYERALRAVPDLQEAKDGLARLR